MRRNVILIVDDDRVSAQVMVDALAPLDAESHRASDGVEAVARIRDLAPDLVITDIEMPRMDGHKLIQWIRTNPDVDALVIAATSHSTPQDELEILEGGADEFLAKPIREPILRARVRSLLRLRDQMIRLQESNARHRAAVVALEEQRQRMDAQARKLEEITITDELTEIYNRRFLNRRGEEEFSLSVRYGTALISRYALHDPLSVTFPPTPPTFSKGFVVARLDHPRWPDGLDIVSIHLDFARSRVRGAQIDRLIEVLRERRRPVLIMGDFNMTWKAGNDLQRLADTLALESFEPEARLITFPTTGARLDWILVPRELAIEEYRVLDDVVSDHRGVVARLRVR